jgi:hypothetical protein
MKGVNLLIVEEIRLVSSIDYTGQNGNYAIAMAPWSVGGTADSRPTGDESKGPCHAGISQIMVLQRNSHIAVSLLTCSPCPLTVLINYGWLPYCADEASLRQCVA